MKTPLPLTFALLLLGGCSAPASEPAGSSSTSPPAVAAPLSSDVARADAKAQEALVTLGSVLHGAKASASFELGEAFALHYVSPVELASASESTPIEAIVHDAVDRVYPVTADGDFGNHG